jgi:peroxiredoxin
MMKKNMIGISLVSLIGLFSCGEGGDQTDGKVAVSGKIENAPEGYVVLSQFTDTRPIVLDTLELSKNGEFSYELVVDVPTFYDLNLFGEKSVRLALDKEDVNVVYDFQNAESLEITGSQDTKEMVKIEKLMTDYQLKVNKLNEAYYEAMSANNSDAVKKIQGDAMSLENDQSIAVKETINSMGNSFATLAAIGLLNTKNEFQFIDDLTERLDQNYPENKMIIQLRQQLDEMRALSLGQVAPDFELPTPEGNMVKLSDLRGKYVMIDFWAAWCKPCREENPNVVRLYEEYKDRGFDIIGVSLDRTKEAWIGAIEQDGLTWTQVSDLAYFNSAAATLYQIEAIPATYLLDPEGRIIGKDLRGPSLENKLAEIFNK